MTDPAGPVTDPAAPVAGPAAAVLHVGEDGIRLRSDEDFVADVLFDGRRIWSFWVLRDSEPDADGTRFVAWPKRLTRFLDGRTRLSIRAHVEDRELYDADVRFGSSEEPISVVNADGQELGMDKYGRLQVTFETRTSRDVEPLLDAVEEVLDALRRAGVEPFLAYGTLLGAVRQGGLIGHDSDADLGYVSRHTAPVDVVRESYRLQRRLAEAGYQVRRYSGAGFAVLVEEDGGVVRGLDVFGGFFSEGHLVLMGEIRVPFAEEWVRPLGTTLLEGRRFPAPADTDRFLSATYGPSWRVPDPAFSFGTPPSTSRRLDDWFRGLVVRRSEWDARYQASIRERVAVRPSRLARMVLADETEAGLDGAGVVVDLGCGRGQNAYWLARRGLRTEGLDYSHRGYQDLRRRAAEKGYPARYGILNLLETRHVLAHGARLARVAGRHTVLARHLVDALPAGRGRDNLWRLADMTGRAGGRMYLDFLTAAAEDDPWARRHLLRPVDVAQVERGLRSAGGTVLLQEEFTPGPAPEEPADGNDDQPESAETPRTLEAPGTADDGDDGDDGTGRRTPEPGDRFASQRRGCRMVVEWRG